MRTTLLRQPEGMSSPMPGNDLQRFASLFATTATTHHAQLDDGRMVIVNRIGHDDYDDGLVHAHGWAAAKQ